MDWCPLPVALAPMLATPGEPPRDRLAEWAVELKWDGVRALAFVSGGRVRLAGRTGKDISASYPELSGLAAAVAGKQALLDGEVVAFTGGRPDFEALQPRIHVSSPAEAALLARVTPASFLIFDLLHLDGVPLLGRPYAERRELLKKIIRSGPGWLCPPDFPGQDLDAVRAAAIANGLEGVVVKRLGSCYEAGIRSADWIKVKHLLRQEVVVAGWKPGKGNRAGLIGSLLVGVHAGPAGRPGPLLYCGHVGTGFSGAALRALTGMLAALRRPDSPFDGPVPAEHARPAVWVEPRLVIEVAFSGWTRAGRMRAPSYQGLRDDKDPLDVVAEA